MEFIPGFLDESGPFIDDINVSEVELLARSENLILELGNLGKIEPFEVIDKGEVTELLEKVRAGLVESGVEGGSTKERRTESAR